MLDTLPGAVLLVEDGRCIDGNAAAAELFGVAGSEGIVGLDISRFLAPVQPAGNEFEEMIDARIRDAMQGGPRKFLWRCRRADGTTFDAKITLVAIHIDDSKAVLVLIRDAFSENRLFAGVAERGAEAAVPGSSVSVVIWDPEMNIRAVDSTFLCMTGCERRIVESMSIRDFESLDRTAGSIADAIRSGGTVVEEVTLDLPAGPRTLIRSSTPFFDGDGNVSEILTVYRDIAPWSKRYPSL